MRQRAEPLRGRPYLRSAGNLGRRRGLGDQLRPSDQGGFLVMVVMKVKMAGRKARAGGALGVPALASNAPGSRLPWALQGFVRRAFRSGGEASIDG